jgi:hypothetical protein
VDSGKKDEKAKKTLLITLQYPKNVANNRGNELNRDKSGAARSEEEKASDAAEAPEFEGNIPDGTTQGTKVKITLAELKPKLKGKKSIAETNSDGLQEGSAQGPSAAASSQGTLLNEEQKFGAEAAEELQPKGVELQTAADGRKSLADHRKELERKDAKK